MSGSTSIRSSTVDFRLSLAGLTETADGYRARRHSSRRRSRSWPTRLSATELQNLPSLTRTISGLLELLPGATPVAPLHRTKENVGTVSYGGIVWVATSTMNVDGADNRDNHYSGPLLTFTTESLEQFQLARASSPRRRPHGRCGGHPGHQVGDQPAARVGVRLRARSEADAKDFFVQKRQRGEGAVQPAAVRWIDRRSDHPEPDVLLRRARAAVRGSQRFVPEQNVRTSSTFWCGRSGPDSSRRARQSRSPPYRQHSPSDCGCIHSRAPHSSTTPTRSRWRYAGQHEGRDSVTWTLNNDDGQPDDFTIDGVQRRRPAQLGDRERGPESDYGAGQPRRLPRRCVEPGYGRSTTRKTSRTWTSSRRGWPFRRSRQGQAVTPARWPTAGYSRFATTCRCSKATTRSSSGSTSTACINLGILNGNEHYATLTFFDDASTILNNTNGRYPQGFQTPGIVRAGGSRPMAAP